MRALCAGALSQYDRMGSGMGGGGMAGMGRGGGGVLSTGPVYDMKR